MRQERKVPRLTLSGQADSEQQNIGLILKGRGRVQTEENLK